jgi:uncharacterized protein (DUF169 family)
MMIMENIRAHLGMKYNLVGVKILKEKPVDIEKPTRKLRYCEMVRKAANGEVITAEHEDIACPNAEVTLGFVEPVYVDIQPRISPAETKVVKVGPLDKIRDPDIILAILNPRQAMEVASIMDGLEAKFAGSMAVCGEATAKPYMEKKSNVTMLCGGARTFADFRDSDLIVGGPPEFFEELSKRISALSKTCVALCGCKTSDLSPRIIESFRKIGFEKGTDYFFGKVDGTNVRIYLNKDTHGKIKYITVHIPLRGVEVKAKEPLIVKKRGNWTDVAMTFGLGEAIDLNTGRGLKEAIMDILKKVSDSKVIAR